MGEVSKPHPCPKGDGCALNKGAVSCFHCGRNWPPDETWVWPEPMEGDPLDCADDPMWDGEIVRV